MTRVAETHPRRSQRHGLLLESGNEKRTMTRISAIGFLLCGLLNASITMAQTVGNPEAGQVKAIPCMGCHGIPGYYNVYPTYHVPKVGGQHAAYIVTALRAYKSGERDHRTMVAQATSLSEQDMADIAAYFESQGGE